jgi:hypothetical protein
MHLDAKVTVIQRGKQIPVPGIVHYQGDVVADKLRAADGPFRSAAFEGEEAFPSGDETTVAHYEFILRTMIE